MDGALSASEQETLVDSFLEIAVGQSADTARQFLQVQFTLSFSSITLYANAVDNRTAVFYLSNWYLHAEVNFFLIWEIRDFVFGFVWLLCEVKVVNFSLIGDYIGLLIQSLDL